MYDTKEKKNFDCGGVDLIFTVLNVFKPPLWSSLSAEKLFIMFDLK